MCHYRETHDDSEIIKPKTWTEMIGTNRPSNKAYTISIIWFVKGILSFGSTSILSQHFSFCMCSTIDILLSADYRTKRYEKNFPLRACDPILTFEAKVTRYFFSQYIVEENTVSETTLLRLTERKKWKYSTSPSLTDLKMTSIYHFWWWFLLSISAAGYTKPRTSQWCDPPFGF